MHDYVTYTKQNDLIEKQIRADASLSRQLQEEEKGQVLKWNNHVEYDDPSKYHIDRFQAKLENNDEQILETEDRPFARSFTSIPSTKLSQYTRNRKSCLKNTFRIFSGKGWFTHREYNRELLQCTNKSYFQFAHEIIQYLVKRVIKEYHL